MQTKKKPNLVAALAERPAEPEPQSPKPAQAPTNERGRSADRRTRDRKNKTQIAGWFPLPVSLQLDELRLRVSRERGRKVTLNELQAEAYNDLFKKYGLAEIAPGAAE
jgi:hypothetical protein